MNYLYLGKLVNTHGIKGEVRILSDFKYKNNVFIKGITLYLGKSKKPFVINSYRVHKQYDMVTFDGVNDINDILIYKGDEVYFDKDAIKFDGLLNEDLIGLEVYSDRYLGKVIEILDNKVHSILVIEKDNNINMVPYIDEFIVNVDLSNKRIDIKEIEGLINEN